MTSGRRAAAERIGGSGPVGAGVSDASPATSVVRGDVLAHSATAPGPPASEETNAPGFLPAPQIEYSLRGCAIFTRV